MFVKYFLSPKNKKIMKKLIFAASFLLFVSVAAQAQSEKTMDSDKEKSMMPEGKSTRDTRFDGKHKDRPYREGTHTNPEVIEDLTNRDKARLDFETTSDPNSMKTDPGVEMKMDNGTQEDLDKYKKKDEK